MATIEIKHRITGAVLYTTDAETVKAACEKAIVGGAYLYGADLRRADLCGADLCGADLCGAKINWQSHGLISELLWRGSDGNAAREQLAAWIGRKTDWCWEDWLRIEHPDREWALAELAKWVTPDDGSPAAIQRLAEKAAQQTAPITVG